MLKKLTKKRIYIIILVVLVVAVLLEVLLAHPHGSEIWHTLPGADVIFGFVGAWVLILFAKKVLAPWLQRKEDYYDGGSDDE